MISSELQEIDKIALAYCMNPTVSFETMSNSYWLAAFGEVLAPVRGKKI
jgi:CO dehydrogenase/acetyl-CoA synthase epsilon subunit